MGNLNLCGRVASTTGPGTADLVAEANVPAKARIMLRKTDLAAVGAGYAIFSIRLLNAAGTIVSQFQTVIRPNGTAAAFSEDLEIPMEAPDDPSCRLVILVESSVAAIVATASLSGRVA